MKQSNTGMFNTGIDMGNNLQSNSKNMASKATAVSSQGGGTT